MARMRVELLSQNLLTRLERRLSALGPVWATVALSAAAIAVAVCVNVFLKMFVEHAPVTTTAFINIPVEGIVVAAPLILYSRRVIRELAKSRGELEVMTDKLAVAANEARESSKAKSAFLANMSHELRTPLNAILGFSEIMKDQHLGPVSNPRYLSYAGDIHSSGRHLLGIINDILDLAKIESGKMTLDDAEEFALVPALSASLAMLKGLGDKHGVTVRGEWDEEDVRLVAVERMVRQIVINLVGNAVKFTPHGGSVVLSGGAHADGGYILRVRDTGVGMSESEIANALTPFGQNRAKMAVQHEGTGLGLPLAKAMIELHGGSLSVDSQPNRGTCITLLFPPERMAQPTEQAAA
jgi:signal transduction histidine kinase